MYEKQAGVDRFQAWALASRTRFALVWGGINAVIVYSLTFFASPSQISVRDVVLFTALAVAVHGLFHYPRAKRNVTDAGRDVEPAPPRELTP